MTSRIIFSTTDPFLTTKEAAQRLGVTLRTVQLWVEAGHRASQCPRRRAAALKAQAAGLAARIILAPAAAVRWLHQHPDALTTGAALIAGAACLYLISTGA